MGVLLKIAYRNLREHKTKTLIIGSLIALGMVILVVGNSALDTATAGIQANYTKNYTGQVIVAASAVKTPSLTPDSGTASSSDEPVPTIPDFQETMSLLESTPGVQAVNPIITGFALAQQDSEGFGIMQFYGVDPEMYQTFFPGNLDITEGKFLEPGQQGVVISEWTLHMLRESTSRDIGVGDKILLTTQSKVYGVRIRELPIVGVFTFKSASLPLEFVSFVDLNDARILNGMTGITDLNTALSDSERALLGSVNEDDLFGSDTAGALPGVEAQADAPITGDALAGGVAVSNFDSILGDTSIRSELNTVDPNAWHYILLKLNDSRSGARTAASLNAEFRAKGLDLVAFNWLDGAGQMAKFTYALKTVFNILVILVAVVAVIIIMNTLVISVTERIAEIGTMRAIGAQKRFVRSMILLETLMIALVFGAIGIGVGAAITGILGAVGIQSDNLLLQVFMGGPTLNPVVSFSSIISSLIAVVLAGLLASLYPASIALRIQPVTAMNSN